MIDIGGGSTEVVVGIGGRRGPFHVSMQLGVVRQTERFMHTDPPSFEQLEDLADDVRSDPRTTSCPRICASGRRGDRRRRHGDVGGGDRARARSV